MKINYPPHAWLVAMRDYETDTECLSWPDGTSLNIPNDRQECYTISAD